jgi:hypothetical protein
MFLAAACSSPGLLLGFLFCLTSPTIILVKVLFGFGVLSPFEVLGLLRLQKLENGIEKTQDLDILYYRFLQNLQCRIFLHKLSIYAFIYPLYLRVHTSCAYLVIPVILV